MNIVRKSGKIENRIGEEIEFDVRFSADIEEKQPALFLLHGFKGFKDWGFFPYIAEKFAEGCLAVSFNFSLNGMVSGSDCVVYPENFARNTISQELEDLDTIIKAFKEGLLVEKEFAQKYWNGEIYLMGHSLGGGIAIIYARGNDFVKKAAVWSPVAKFDRYTERQKKIWKEAGYIEFTHSRTQQPIKMQRAYLDDIEKNADKFDIIKAAKQLKCPLLIVHGIQDVTVPREEGQSIEKAAGSSSQAFYPEKASHVFGADHPFKKASGSLKEAVKKTIKFFGITVGK